jgi:hypothetical protein
VFKKTAYTITAIVLGLSFSVLSTEQAKAQSAESTVRLMYGHPMVKMLEEMNPEAVVIGRVRGQSGGILSVEFLNPTSVSVGDRDWTSINIVAPNWNVVPGDDIVLAYHDGGWHYIGEATCQMAWISRLNLKDVNEVQRSTIDWGENRQPVSLPPLQERTVEVTPPEAEVNPPVPGMW